MSSIRWPTELWVVASVSRHFSHVSHEPLCPGTVGEGLKGQSLTSGGHSLFGKPNLTHVKHRAHQALVSPVPIHGAG